MAGIKEEIDILKKMKANNAFPNYIDYIRYPNFKNLEKNTKIKFDFPLTFFVGKNGGGKSSTLQSLYGSPKGKSLGDYWFETELDPINDLKENRNCFIYSSEDKEVIKQRAPRENNLDYWETSRPIAKYNMDINKRNTPITKQVEYIDFRSELSAYDSYMYFTPFKPSKKINKKQDYVRRYSKNLKKAFEGDAILSLNNRIKNKRVVKLNSDQIESVSRILGKPYSSIEIIEHSFFKNWGFSVKFSAPDLSYSEAFAGSGETAVMVLIHRISECEKNSLLLLDEPEVSLHPGAQIRLRDYLLEQIKVKRIQVVISTHSPFFLKDMPEESIKVFSTNSNGKFHVENKRNPNEAFYELEVETAKINLIVEDELAKMILQKFLLKKGEDIESQFNIKHFPGGANEIKQRVEVFMHLDSRPYILLDGDQKLVDTHIDTDKCMPAEIDTPSKLKAKIKAQTGCDIAIYSDGGNSENEAQKISLMKKYLDYYKKYVYYFPMKIPEEIIWSDSYALKRLKDFDESFNDDTLKEIKNGNSKESFVNLCCKTYGSLGNLKSLYFEFCNNWLKKEDSNFELLNKIITDIKAND